MTKNVIEVGAEYHYRLKKGRGRPYVGEVVRKAGIFTEVKNKISGDVHRVPTGLIGNPYSFKPYKKAA